MIRAEGPGSLPAPEASGEEIRRAAREILERPEFRRPPRTPVEVVLDWIGRMLDKITFSRPGGVGTPNLVGYIVAAAMVAVIVLLLVRYARTIRKDPGIDLPPLEGVGRPSTDWLAEADAHETAGRYRDAVRCRYRGLVAEMAARDVVDEVPGRTSGEYREAVGRAVPDVGADFAAATDLFERAWYGARATGPDEVARIRELAGTVLAQTRRVRVEATA